MMLKSLSVKLLRQRLIEWRTYLMGKQCALCRLTVNNDMPPASPVCSSCANHLPYSPHLCQSCPTPIAESQQFCGQCLRQPSVIDHLLIPFDYQPPLSHWIPALKFHRQTYLSQWLAHVIAKAVEQKTTTEKPDLLVPVPLHPKRLRWRGFNQAQLIAQGVAKQLALPLNTRLVKKIRATAEQTSLNASERNQNMRNAFYVCAQPPARIAIIDDVITTGSTVRELAKQLKKAGCKEVHVWSAARSVAR